MRVSITHKELTTGLILKKTYHAVTLQLTFSNEELAIIKQRRLESDIILERDIPADVKPSSVSNPDIFHLTIGKLVRKGEDTYVTSSPLDAKVYEEKLVERLRMLKDYIVGNAETGQNKTFEL